MTLRFWPDGVENPENVARLREIATALGATLADAPHPPLIAIENAPGASSVYGRSPLRAPATLVLGNERRGISRSTLDAAGETVEIPLPSRSVRSLNVAAAGAVAGWYLMRGSGPQRTSTRPEARRPTLLIVGDDHVEVGSSLRSAAAFGYDLVHLDGASGWFDGPAAVKREARAAARRHKNRLRIRHAAPDLAQAFAEIVLVQPTGTDPPPTRLNLARGAGQLVVIGGDADSPALAGARRCSLGLSADAPVPLRAVASIALAEIARQVGRRRPGTRAGGRRPVSYDLRVPLDAGGDEVTVPHEELLAH